MSSSDSLTDASYMRSAASSSMSSAMLSSRSAKPSAKPSISEKCANSDMSPENSSLISSSPPLRRVAASEWSLSLILRI